MNCSFPVINLMNQQVRHSNNIRLINRVACYGLRLTAVLRRRPTTPPLVGPPRDLPPSVSRLRRSRRPVRAPSARFSARLRLYSRGRFRASTRHAFTRAAALPSDTSSDRQGGLG